MEFLVENCRLALPERHDEPAAETRPIV